MIISTDLVVRRLTAFDRADVLAIAGSSPGSPLEPQEFDALIQDGNVCGLAAAPRRGPISGFLLWEIVRGRSKFHIFGLAVWPPHRRRGVGRLLLGNLQGKLRLNGCDRATILVPEGNLDGQLFLRACDWQAVAVVRGCCEDGDGDLRDAYKFCYRMPQAAGVGR